MGMCETSHKENVIARIRFPRDKPGIGKLLIQKSLPRSIKTSKCGKNT